MSGQTAAGYDPRSPLRYVKQLFRFSTTSNLTAQVMGMVPAGGAVLKDVVLSQVVAGTGGTSWKATPKVNGVALCTTDGVIALTDGANASVNQGHPNRGGPPMLTKPAGATRPVIKRDATPSPWGGEAVTIDITLTGVYSGAVSGMVELAWEPRL